MNIKTKIKELDETLGGGIKTHSLVYVSGLKESNYNIFAYSVIENIAKSFEISTGFFCLNIDARMYLNYLEKKYKDGLQMWKHNIFVNNSNDILCIENIIRELHKEGVKFFLIDGILNITNYKFHGDGTATDDVYLRLEALKNELDIVVLVLVQVNKNDVSLYDTEYADEKADIWLHLIPKNEGIKEVKIIKNKQSKNKKSFEYKIDMEF